MNPHEYAQEKDGWCGAAALSWALAEQGVNVSQEDIAREMHNSLAGVDPQMIKKTAERHGMRTFEVDQGNPEKTLALLDNYKQLGWSVILDYLAGNDIHRDGHYVVLLDVIPRGLRIFDPSNGGSEEVRNKESFFSRWRDTTKTGKVLHAYALLLKRRK